MAQDKQEKSVEWIHVIVAFFTFVAVLIAMVALVTQCEDSSTQRFNTAWLLVNSSGQPSAYTALANQPKATTETTSDAQDALERSGGRKKALTFLKESDQSLQGAFLSQSVLSYIDLNGTDLNRATMVYADLFGTDLRASSLWSASMKDANLQFARLQGANMENAILKCADMRGAHLEPLQVHSYLKDIGFGSPIAVKIWEHVPFTKTLQNTVKNEYITHKLKDNVWPNTIPTNLTKAHFEFAHLEGADLTEANLKYATFKNAHLERYRDIFGKTEPCARGSEGLIGLKWPEPPTEPTPSELCDWASKHPDPKHPTVLPNSFCCGSRCAKDQNKTPDKPAANLTNADLTGAILTGANLTGVNLTGAILTGADLTRASVVRAQIADAGILCHTLLPSNMRDMEDQDCPTSPAVKGSDERTHTSQDPHESPLGSSGPHEDMCNKYQNDEYMKDALTRFASRYPCIKKYCLCGPEKPLAHGYDCSAEKYATCKRPQGNQNYLGCLHTQFQAFTCNRQSEINKIPNDFKNAKVLSIEQLYRDPFQFKDKAVAVIGSWDRFVSETEAMFGGKDATIIITVTDGQTVRDDGKVKSGKCIVLGKATGMKPSPVLGNIANIDFDKQECGLDYETLDTFTRAYSQ